MKFSLLLNTPNIIFSISELNYNAKLLLEQSIPLIWISGEISNLKRYHSGHWYFSLKDDDAQARCVMFYHKNRYLDWQPCDGMQVEVRAYVTLYEPRGEFQLNIETIRRAGLGRLFAAFEQLKDKLDKAGLFNPINKKKLPKHPQQIGIITSPSAAALYDVLSTLKKRMPAIAIIIYPTLVQGEKAAENITNAIQLAIQHDKCETLIICRGGGSIEDLWPFNEESVANAIYACPIPTISGIGHETDFTITDFVADARAPTPTGAAQLACQDNKVLIERINIYHNKIQQNNQYTIERLMQKLDILSLRLIHPGKHIHNQRNNLQHLYERLTNAWLNLTNSYNWTLLSNKQQITSKKTNITQLTKNNLEKRSRLQHAMQYSFETTSIELNRLLEHLNHLNPNTVLSRGYSISYTADGQVIRNNKQINQGDNIHINFAVGQCDATILNKHNNTKLIKEK